MVHVDVKELGRVPDGGGWQTMGTVGKKIKKKPAPTAYSFLRSAIDDHSCAVYSEILTDEKGATAQDSGSAQTSSTGRGASLCCACSSIPVPATALVLSTPRLVKRPTSSHRSTDRRRTTKSNASTAPWLSSGLTPPLQLRPRAYCRLPGLDP